MDAGPEEIATAAIAELAEPLPEKSPKLNSWDECAGALLDLYGSLLKIRRPSSAQTSTREDATAAEPG
jgi:hypothetical protein